MRSSASIWLWRRLATSRPASAKPLFPKLVIHCCTNSSSAAAILEKHGANTVEVFWDMDNKPPLAMAPAQAVKGLKELAAKFGTLVDVVVYASKHSLKHLPSWKQVRSSGVEAEKEEEVFLCDFCGRRWRSNYALQKHFQRMHETEHEKRVAGLGSMKKRGKRSALLRIRMEQKEKRFHEVARTISLTDKGYGLAADLRRGGMPVLTVSNKPDAAALALYKHMLRSVDQGINCVWLLSHNTRFVEILELAGKKQLHSIVTSKNPKLQKRADICLTWEDILSRIATVDPTETAYLWSLEDSLRGSPSRNNFLTAELSHISGREDLRDAIAFHNLKECQNLDSDSDQFESTSDSLSELDSESSDGGDFCSDTE